MASEQRLGELEFELALIGVLGDVYGVSARVRGDALNRRSCGYATLEFAYDHPENASGNTKVVVTICDVPDCSFAFSPDFSCSESIVRAVDECEDLALAVRDHLGSSDSWEELEFERRWDD
jgi:hypothetical protein